MIFIEGTYRDLIIKYLSGECNPEETQHMLEWIQSSDDHFRFFIEVKEVWEAADEDLEQDDAHLSQAWNVLDEKLKATTKEKKGTLIKMHPSLKTLFKVAAVVIIGFFSWKYFVPEVPSPVLVADTFSGQKEIQLSDGTLVQLNYLTNFEYPDQFDQSSRKVKLSGESYFNVAPDKTKPFIIDAGEVHVQVIGTSFNVNSRPDLDVISVVVESGKVLVYQTGNENNQVVLVKGDQANFNKNTNTFEKNTVIDINELSWKSGDLVFRNSKLKDVFKALERHYNVSFTAEESKILELPLTTKFNDNSLDESLSVISTIFQLEFEQRDSLIIVKSKF